MERIALSDRDFPFHYEKVMQKLFLLAAVIPSVQAGLISSDGITLTGDGTCVHTHSNPYGHKVCGCSANDISHCDCPRHYSDPDAHWGWDSNLGCYYWGYTLYMLSYHNPEEHVDLPLHIRFLDARRHDSVSIYKKGRFAFHTSINDNFSLFIPFPLLPNRSIAGNAASTYVMHGLLAAQYFLH